MKTHTELDDLPIIKDYKVSQISTHGHDRPIPSMGMWKEQAKQGIMHRDNVSIQTGGKFTFPEINGPGKIINIWFTFTPEVPFPKDKEPQSTLLGKEGKKIIRKNLKGFLKMISMTVKANEKPILHKQLLLQIFFDDEKSPSVDCPIGDFFGTGFGQYKHYWSRYLNTTAGGYVCNFHMPFKKKARIEIVNTSQTHAVIAFYGAITYAEYKSEENLKDMGYFHAKYHEEHPTTPGTPYLFLDTKEKSFLGKESKGHLVGVVLSAKPVFPKKNGFNYLEGNTKMYIDGNIEPSIEYTGTEDIFQGAWYYVKGVKRKQTEFHTLYHGLNVKSMNNRGAVASFLWAKHTKCKTSQYRFYPEGIPFDRCLKVTLHHGEFDEVPADYDSVAYWYQEH